uniref:ATP synthase F0 subunit 6 n=1 Tax=Leocrates chinensis TaxID=378359 RepID=UPI0021D535DC|nr:ATP synthase F0 subunit 6 [Leocrates chinensis]UXC96462.1 ATP synthase F0 subunit 6 [Leocrates chinensis]
MITPSFWLSPSMYMITSTYPIDIMNSQSNRTLGSTLKGFSNMITALFILIMSTNLMGLIPYSFSFSSHLLMTLTLGLPLWLSLIASAVTHAPSTWAASLLPGGAPDILNPFLVMIETVSISVRPITLSFRLAANMTAGHIILSLAGVYASAGLFSSMISFISLFMVQTFYIIFEVGICLIQGYIFCLLLTLYADEHPTS